MNNKIKEIKNILNIEININTQIQYLKDKYKKELENFIYIEKINQLYEYPKLFIRYIGINGKLGWGGILLRIEQVNNKFFIYLINKKKKSWYIEFDKNYIFYQKIIKTNNENIRNIFTDFLTEYTN
jgi:hypothetical protein